MNPTRKALGARTAALVATLRGTSLTVLLALAAAAWAQPTTTFGWEDPDGQCWLVGQVHNLGVSDAPEGATLHWGDGQVDNIPAGDGSYPHAYSLYGTYTPEIRDADGEMAGETWSQAFYEYELDPSSFELTLGDELTITLTALPDEVYISDMGELDWGDGTVVAAQASGSYSHTYAEAGVYTVSLGAELAFVTCDFAAVQVRVMTPGVNVDPLTPRIDQPVTANVDDEPAGGTLAWGNGDEAALDGSGSYELAAGYADDLTYTIDVLDASGASVASTTVPVRTPSLSLSAGNVNIGAPLEALVVDAPEGGMLDWGDGDTEFVLGDGSYTHGYAAPGSYEVTLTRANGDDVASELVNVTSATLTVSPTRTWPAEPVIATVTNEPAGGSLDWDEGGGPSPLNGSGEYQHRFDMAGEYLVQLLDADGSILGSELVIIVEPALELLGPPDTEVGRTVSVAVSDTNSDVELDWGDGSVEAIAGDGTYDHEYDEAGIYDVLLLDADFGDVLASVRVTVGEAEEADATITVLDIDYRPEDVVIAVEVLLDGLAAGRDYLLQSPASFDVLNDVDTQERLTLEFDREGDHTLNLERAGTGEVVATHELELAWPRAGEIIDITFDDGGAGIAGGAILAGDFPTFVITGLEPGYHYLFRPDGTDDFERRIHGVESWTERGLFDQPGFYEATLTVQYPGFYGPPELRATLPVEVVERSGAIELPGARLPYGRETSIVATDLIPGTRYRLDFGDGRTEEFTAFAASESFTHTYMRLPRPLLLESYVNGGRIWELVDTADPGDGLDLTGTLALEHGGSVAGDVQTFVAHDLVPGAEYHFRLSRPLSATERVPVLAEEVTADEAGTARIEVTIPREHRALEENTPLVAHLDVEIADEPVNIQNLAVLLPPLQRTLHRYVVEITELTRPLTPDNYTFPELHAKGVVRDFALAGRLQGDLEFEFLNQYQADITEPFDLEVPAQLNGLALRFTELTIAAYGVRGYAPSFAGTGTLAGADLTFDSRGAAGSGAQGEGEFSRIFQETGELLLPGRHSGRMSVGDTGWVIDEQDSAGFVIDLSTESQYRLFDAAGSRLVVEESYAGWNAAGATPTPDPASDAWLGVLFVGSNTIMRDPARFGSEEWLYQLDTPYRDAAISWTGGGFNFEYRGNQRMNQFHGWDVTHRARYQETVVNSRVVTSQPALLEFQLPLFEAPLLVRAKPGDGADRELVITGSVPVARDFGLSALIADQPRLVVRGSGDADIAFGRAIWTLDQELAASGSNLDTSVSSAMRQNLAGMSLPPEVSGTVDGALAALDTAENLMGLQLPLDGLTVGSDGNVSIGGETWKTLGRSPELDMYGFPYMSGGDADIGIKREGDQYAIGLRGGLSLGGIVTATAAPSWYYVKDGAEQRWVFEGVNATLGDPNGLVETPATFNLTVGGLVSLTDDDDSLEFNGAGELTVGVSSSKGGAAAEEQLLNIQVAGVFGINDTTADMKPYWFVYAGTDLAAMGRPIPVKVKGVDIFAFYAFRGGIGHNLRLDQRTGFEANETCAVDDAFVGDDPRPAVIRNALDCFDDDNDLALLAGTVIGWYQQGADDYYGLLWHVNANLTLNSSGQVILGGRGWAFKTLDDGYRADATPNMMARISADANGIFGSFCLGAVGSPIGELDCSGLEEVSLTIGGFKLLEAEANAELKASWTSGEYYFAIGRQSKKVRLFIFPDYTEGYVVAGYINTPGIVEGPLPAAGMWASMYVGKAWDWSFSEDVFLCDLEAWARAGFKFGGAVRIQVEPEFGFDGELGASAYANAGVSCGVIDTSVSVRIDALGRVTAPDPFGFRGTMTVTGDLPVIGEIEVSIPEVNLSF